MIERLDTGLGILQITGLFGKNTRKNFNVVLGTGCLYRAALGAECKRRCSRKMSEIRARSFNDPNARGYQTDIEMELHTDVADITGLLCLNKALEGGDSQIASSISVLNTLIEQEPAQHLLDREFYFDWRGEEGEGEPYFCGWNGRSSKRVKQQ